MVQIARGIGLLCVAFDAILWYIKLLNEIIIS